MAGHREKRHTRCGGVCVRNAAFLTMGVFHLLSSEPAVGCVPSQRLLEGARSTKQQARKGLACAKYVWSGNLFCLFLLVRLESS